MLLMTTNQGSPMLIEDSIRDTDAWFAEAFNRGDLVTCILIVNLVCKGLLHTLGLRNGMQMANL